MNQKGLRPFENREHRLFRNALSEGFMESILRGDINCLESLAEKYRSEKIGPVKVAYLADRMDRYRTVFHSMVLTESTVDGVLKAGFLLWDYGLFFEMHEWLEQLWKKSCGDEKRLIQGLIRAAGARVHLEAGDRDKAISMSVKAVKALRGLRETAVTYFNADLFISDLESLDSSATAPGRYDKEPRH